MTKVSKKAQHRLEVLKDNKVVLKLWSHYKNFYQKEYETPEEEKKRLGKFIDNLKIIIKENARFNEGAKSFKLHLNHFGDMDLPEFRKKMTGLKVNRAAYTDLLLMQRRKRFLFDSVKKKVKKMKDKIDKKLHPGKNRTNDSARRPTTTATSELTLDYRPYMNPIENQGQCG
jgi:hypothetical protein